VRFSVESFASRTLPGRCHDRTVYGPEGGDLLTDDGPRLCYEVRRYLPEALTLPLVDLVRKQEGKRQGKR
jgi:hypothetical protein